MAVLARYHGIPFHIAAPVSTFDLSISKAEEIVIEERNPEEILSIGGHPVALSETKVFNPAFDITNSDLITSIITEKGIIKPPYKKNIKTVLS